MNFTCMMAAMAIKSILITGSTDGIGLEVAKAFAADGHTLLLHGRNAKKLNDAQKLIQAVPGAGVVETYRADLTDLKQVQEMADKVRAKHEKLDVLMNNAGVFKTSSPILPNGQDIRFIVNAVSPYLLTKNLLDIIPADGRVINLSSAAQRSYRPQALTDAVPPMDDFSAYAGSKLAITQWSAHLAQNLPQGPAVIAVNPGSMLGTKMVQAGFGVSGNDIQIGSDILYRAALSDEFNMAATGKYYDNDSRRFAPPHADAQNKKKCAQVVDILDEAIEAF